MLQHTLVNIQRPAFGGYCSGEKKTMKLRILVVLFILAIGLISVKVWTAFRWSAHKDISVNANNRTDPQPLSQKEAFSGGEFTNGSYTYYFSSDGASIFYGCSTRSSLYNVDRALRVEIGNESVIERAPKVNDKGEKIGTRVVLSRPSDMEPKAASIVWTEGTYLFAVHAPSLKYAQEFEMWQAGWKYRSENCHTF
jgi:hypothetical protein